MPEPRDEKPEQLLSSVLNILHTKLDIKCDNIERCHRLGTRKSEKPRPAIIKLLDFRTKVHILSNASKLKGTDIFINEDFSVRVRQIRKELWQHSADLRKEAEKVRLQYDQLVIDSVRYVWDDSTKSIVESSSTKSIVNTSSTKSIVETSSAPVSRSND